MLFDDEATEKETPEHPSEVEGGVQKDMQESAEPSEGPPPKQSELSTRKSSS
jgi:hypothetical protein